MKPCQQRRRRSVRWLESRLRRIDAKIDSTTNMWPAESKRCHTRRHELANQVQAAWAVRDGLYLLT